MYRKINKHLAYLALDAIKQLKMTIDTQSEAQL